jgi:anti-sigma regulatory factor (Ser/Thr protein kinase)
MFADEEVGFAAGVGRVGHDRARVTFHSDRGRSLELDLAAEPESPARVRQALREALAGVAVDIDAVELAVSEAVANVTVHAYRDTRPPGADPGRVRVSARIDGDELWVVISDDGVGMAPRPDSPGLGLGLPLIAQLSDGLGIEQRATGSRMVIRFRLAA